MRGKLPLAALAALAIGVVIGFVLGGIGPRRELAAREVDVRRLERALEEGGESGGGAWRSPVPGLDRILRDPEEGRAGVPLPAAEGEEGDTVLAEPADPSFGDAGVRPLGVREGWGDEGTPEDRFAAFQRVASVQRVRVAQSRAALFEQAELADEERSAVDDALREMNREIRGHGEELLFLGMSDAPPSARDLLGITHDVTGILHRAQVRLEEILGPERMANVDPSALEIWNHVDLTQLEPAAREAIDRASGSE